MAGKRKQKKRRFKPGNLLILLLPVILIAGLLYFFNLKNNQKPIQTTPEEVVFTVPAGAGAKTISQKLADEGIIRSGSAGYSFAKKNKLTDIKAGNFLLDKSWELEQIYTTLNDSTATIVDDVRVTIVEGDWAKHIAEKIAAVTNVSEEELLNLWNDQNYIRSLFDRYPFLSEEMFGTDVRICLEGYLAPNTYIFFQDTTAEEVTEKILDQTLVNYKEVENDIKKSDMTVHQIFTLASIVQYESGKVSEMANIAGVFANRLRIDMPLQSSVTVCYAIDVNKDDDWMACEVNSEFDSPYNTYKYPGLPPGPIQNPGIDALKAVLHPARHDYYYFMADVYGDGTVYYAKTLEEHNANVAKYLK